jgi:hypothetical protein
MLRVLAASSDMPVAEYIRHVLNRHIAESGTAFREKGAVFKQGEQALQSFTLAVKEFILLYKAGATQDALKEGKEAEDLGGLKPGEVGIAGGLVGNPKRAELEGRTWEAFLRAYEFFQTEEAAANAKARLRVLEVVANLARTERAILADIDKAQVDDLLDRVEESLKGVENGKKSSG